MTITEFLDSLIILNDETVNLSIVNCCFCVLLITIIIALILMMTIIIKEYLCKQFDGEMLFICIILFIFFVVLVVVLYSILSTPFTNIYLIISTDNVDKTTLYKYFKISNAPMDDTVKITPKPEFYKETFEWYKCNFTK